MVYHTYVYVNDYLDSVACELNNHALIITTVYIVASGLVFLTFLCTK